VPAWYAEAENFLNQRFFYRQDILKFFHNEETLNFFRAKFHKNELAEYVSWLDDTTWQQYLKMRYGGIRISPAYRLDSKTFITHFREYFLNHDMLIAEQFQFEHLHIGHTSINYKNIKAKKIIFCQGYELLQNPFHKHLPLYANKGEYLIAKIPQLPETETIHAHIGIVPLGNHLFWIGSHYELNFENELPTERKRKEYEQILTQVLKTDFKIVAHSAGIRPTVSNERRPFVGICPSGSVIAILNGLGAKGVSYAPYFAAQLVEFLLHGTPVEPDADVARYEKKKVF
jgi:glycine/D-amino acid oxidase-like deaminating enzyme